jgi:hypothetical protein
MSTELPAEAITADSVLSARPDVAQEEVDGEVVLYDDVAGVMHRLNPTASVLWACLDGTGTLSEIAVDLSRAYRADPDVVLADVVAMTRDLGDKGLLVGIRRSPDDPGAESGTDDAGGDPGNATPASDDEPFVAEPPSP